MRWLIIPFWIAFGWIASTKAASPLNITIQVVNEVDSTLPYPTVGIKRSGQTFSGDKKGYIDLDAIENDTLIVFVKNYKIKQVGLSASNHQIIKLDPLSIELNEISIYDIKSPYAVRKDINKLGIPNRDAYKKANPIFNPLSFLYNKLSHSVKQQKEVATLENEDNKQKALVQLIRFYRANDILDIGDEEINDFIDYVNLSYTQMQRLNDYDLALFIKKKFLAYKSHKG